MAHAGLSSRFKSQTSSRDSYSNKPYVSTYERPPYGRTTDYSRTGSDYGRTTDYSSYSSNSRQRDSFVGSHTSNLKSTHSPYTSSLYPTSTTLPSLESRYGTNSDRLSRKDSSYVKPVRPSYSPTSSTTYEKSFSTYDKNVSSYVPSYRSKFTERYTSNLGKIDRERSSNSFYNISKATSELSVSSPSLKKSFSQFDVSSLQNDKSDKALKTDGGQEEMYSRVGVRRTHPTMGVNSTNGVVDKRLGGSSENNVDGSEISAEKTYRSSNSRRSPSFDSRSSFATQDTEIVRPKRFSSVDRFGSSYGSSSAEKGCTGLRNLGNTCFMNSVLQCLANTQHLLEYCLNSEFESDINKETSRMKGVLISAYADLMKSMWSGKDSVSPTNFKYEVSRFARLFVGYNQQDGQEFLLYLLQGLHEDLNRVREKKKMIMDVSNDVEVISASEKSSKSWKEHLEVENSKIVDLFEGQLKSALTCTVCGYVSNTFDPVLGLSLPIKKGRGLSEVTLMDCVELFTQEEILDDNERTTCARCKQKQKSTKRLSIQKFPQILVINLKRFNDENAYRSKLSTNVKCPLRNLDLRKFSDERGGSGAVYDLYALCNHSGTPSGGHYTAAAKNPYSDEWHYFNDHRVTPISESNVVSSEAYILFYELSSK